MSRFSSINTFGWVENGGTPAMGRLDRRSSGWTPLGAEHNGLWTDHHHLWAFDHPPGTRGHHIIHRMAILTWVVRCCDTPSVPGLTDGHGIWHDSTPQTIGIWLKQLSISLNLTEEPTNYTREASGLITSPWILHFSSDFRSPSRKSALSVGTILPPCLHNAVSGSRQTNM